MPIAKCGLPKKVVLTSKSDGATSRRSGQLRDEEMFKHRSSPARQAQVTKYAFRQSARRPLVCAPLSNCEMIPAKPYAARALVFDDIPKAIFASAQS
jgi:hypothetical protein